MEVRDTTETISQTGLGCSEPVIIRDTDGIDILKVFVGFLVDKFIQTFGARLLHAFKTELEIDG